MPYRYLFGTLALVFLVFALLQLNDPDPALWVALYLLPAAVAARAALRPLPRWPPALLAVLYLALAAWWWPARFDGLTGPMSPHTTVEEGREAMGLLLAALALALTAWLGARRPVPKPRTA